MKLKRWLFVVPIIMVATISYGTAQISVEQAKQSIRSFEGDPNLELPEPKERVNPQALVARTFFDFTLPNGRWYWVDKETGWVFCVTYPRESLKQQGIPISEERAIQIARDFLQDRSTVYQKYKTQMDTECEMLVDRYLIKFTEKIPNNGAYTYNQCKVEIDPYSGKVISFLQVWEKTPHPNRDQKPAVSAQEAANRVAAYFGFSMWDFLDTPRLLALPADWAPFNWNTSGLVWYVEIVGDREIGCDVLGFVDAMTGRILMTDVFLHRPSAFPRVKQPRVCLEFMREREGKIQAERFALRSIVPIVQFREIWLPIEIFRRFGANVVEKGNKVVISVGAKIKFVDNFLRQDKKVYLPVKLLKELFPDKVSSVQFYRREWVRIYIRDKQYFKLFEDLLEDLNSQSMKLRYKTKYRSFLDRRENQWIAYIGSLIILCFFIIFLVVRKRKLSK